MKRYSLSFFIILFFLTQKINAQHTLVKKWETKDSIPVPESVLPVPGKKELYVSLIDGKGNEKDGKGGVAILNKNGAVRHMNWVEGLNAPKGMGIYKNKLYIADLTEVVIVDAQKAKVIKKIPIPETVFLNDVAIDGNGIVYISDTRKNKVYRLINDVPELYLDSVNSANGLTVVGSDLYILAGKELWKINRNKSKTIIASGFESGGDGIEPVGNGDFLVSCWAGLIYYVKADGEIKKLLDVQGKKNTADFAYEAATKTLYVPTFNNYSVIAFELR